MADARIINGMKRFLSKVEVESVYREALSAYQERATEVVITSVSFDGGGSSGQISGDPLELMDACEDILKCIEAEEAGEIGGDGPHIVDFSKGYIES